MTNNSGILDPDIAVTNIITLNSDVTTTNKVIPEIISDKVTEPKIDNNVVFMGKKYQDVQNKKVENVIVLGAQTRSKSSGIPPVKDFEDKSYKQAVISPEKNNSANGRNFTVLKKETPKSE